MSKGSTFTGPHAPEWKTRLAILIMFLALSVLVIGNRISYDSQTPAPQHSPSDFQEKWNPNGPYAQQHR